MCKFCDVLLDESKEIGWKVRSTYADDNICEVITNIDLDKDSKDPISYYNPVDCSKCKGCDSVFSICGYKDSKNSVHARIEFYQKVCDTIVHPFSESIPFNFCPICGKRLSTNINLDEDSLPFNILE